MIPTIRWFRDYDGEKRLQYFSAEKDKWIDVPEIEFWAEKEKNAKKD